MELRRRLDRNLNDWHENQKNAMMLTGARQTGKTFAARKIGKKYKNFIEINFIETPAAKDIFINYNGAKDLLFRISAFASKPIEKGATLIFFDEVQECDEVVTAIKFLVDEGSCRYMLSGSLLGVELNNIRSVPVGYLGITTVYPLDFSEFALNIGISEDVLSHIIDRFDKKSAIDPVVHAKMMELTRLYLVVGGMPASIVAYLESNDLQQVVRSQSDIIALYRKDISKYADKDALKIKEIFDFLPTELNSKNKRFILKCLNEHARYERYKDSFLWLKDAGVAIPTYNVEEPKEPLKLAVCRNLFKLFSNDVGLLSAQYSEGIQLRILNGDKDINFGAVYENFIAQELTTHGFSTMYFNSKRQGELDFVISKGGKVIPIEVKSGKSYTEHRALGNVLGIKEYGIDQAYVFCNDNIAASGKIVYAPIYCVDFITKEVPLPTNYKIDLGAINNFNGVL